MTDIPNECLELAEELKKFHVKNVSVKFLDPLKVCVINFWDKRTYYMIEPLKSGVVPYSYYKSTVYYNPETKEMDFEISVIPPSGVFSLKEGKLKIDLYISPTKKAEKLVIKTTGASKDLLLEVLKKLYEQ